jgi:hypothetical protein
MRAPKFFSQKPSLFSDIIEKPRPEVTAKQCPGLITSATGLTAMLGASALGVSANGAFSLRVFLGAKVGKTRMVERWTEISSPKLSATGRELS